MVKVCLCYVYVVTQNFVLYILIVVHYILKNSCNCFKSDGKHTTFFIGVKSHQNIT